MQYVYKGVRRYIRAGKIGVIPTDTVYGLVASAFDKKAVERIYKVKDRDGNKPYIVLVNSSNDLRKFGIANRDIRVAKKFWPAPVSVILESDGDRFRYIHRDTYGIAFRIPNDKNLRKLLRHTGPLVAPSANPQGHIPATYVSKARKYFGDKVDFYIDGGKRNNSPSTVISITQNECKIIRQNHKDVDFYKTYLSIKAKREVSMHLKGFLDFIREKGVIGLATGIIIGTAVTALVKSLVDQIINPLVGLLVDAETLSTATFSVRGAVIGWGAFLNALINFVIVAAVVYFGFKLLRLDKLDKKK
jgi:L-threonylcarbamoyladenylate synthase